MTQRWGGKCPICCAENTLYLPTVDPYRPFRFVEGKRVYYGNIAYDFVMKCHKCNFEINEYNLPTLDEVIKAERAGRYEDSALGYEQLNLLDKARSLRERDRVTTVKSVQVNINHLLDQVRQGNLVIPYKCPACGAAMKITGETSAERLAHCPYCGGTVAIGDIEKFLSTIL
jgi:DNA-directed RNA polymerase subunit RPC12/RpoP